MGLALDDTLVACLTGSIDGALAVVRLSGACAQEIVQKMAPGKPLQSHRMALRPIYNQKAEIIDRALVVWMQGPASFTGEDVVELHLHASKAVVAEVCAHAQALGARMAEAGEFSERAFAHGKIDLAQAEAVADLVAADSDEAAKAAALRLEGGFSEEVRGVMRPIGQVVATFRAALDFPEYDTGAEWDHEHFQALKKAQQTLQDWLEHGGHTVCERDEDGGLLVAGAPNLGKSTLINRLVGFERVLVSETAGTTRDLVASSVHTGHRRAWVWDSAGIRSQGVDPLEDAGMALAKAKAAEADAVIWLVDGEDPMPPPSTWKYSKLWLVGARADIYIQDMRQKTEAWAHAQPWPWLGFVSGHSGEGLDKIRELLTAHTASPGRFGLRLRHRNLILQACHALERALASSVWGGAAQAAPGLLPQDLSSSSPDLLLCDVEAALSALGEILGEGLGAEILDQIFRKFCIGK